jgi:DNA invertase Pin-like site-specific DNA recombinase
METTCAIYARVSTLIHGQSTTNQTVPLQELADRRGFQVVQEYIDEGVSGVKDNRPALNKLVKDARQGKFKILLCYSIDRLGRSTKHLINLLDELSHYGVTPIFIRENIDLSTPSGKLIFQFIASIAEFEKSLISERIKNSLAVKKALASQSNSNWRCGRPPIDEEVKSKVLELRSQGKSIRGIAKEIGNISKSSVERIIKENS